MQVFTAYCCFAVLLVIWRDAAAQQSFNVCEYRNGGYDAILTLYRPLFLLMVTCLNLFEAIYPNELSQANERALERRSAVGNILVMVKDEPVAKRFYKKPLTIVL